MKHTKKILSAALVLALVLCFLPMTALADSTVMTEKDLKDAISAAIGKTTITLGADIVLTAGLEIPSDKEIILNLNGKTLDRGLALSSATTNGYVIANSGTLTIQDSVGTGIITGGNNSGECGGVLNASGATFTLEAGSITGNKATGYGGGVKSIGSLTIAGGSITSNTAYGGAGVYASSGTFVMTGGCIKDNTASSEYGGGGVYSYSTITMTGGSITGNKADNGKGSGIFNGSTLNLGGTAVVMGNTKNGAANDVENSQYGTINIDSNTAPADGMYVGMYGQYSVVKNATNGQQNHFFADEAGKYVKFDTEKLVLDGIPDNDTANYKITLSYNPESGCYITAPQYAASGDVEVKVFPAEGYQLKSLTVTPDDGEAQDIPEHDGEYKFEMGSAAVTVTAEFELIPTAPIKPLTPARIDFTAISRIVKGVIGLIGVKKTTDDIKTVSILAIIFRIITQLFDKAF